jgi:predicted HTH domain antitoxin
MTLTIPDDVLKETGLSERDLLVELACRLYDSEKLSKTSASRMVGMGRDDFDAELRKRGLPVIRYRDEDVDREIESLRHLEASGFWERKR